MCKADETAPKDGNNSSTRRHPAAPVWDAAAGNLQFQPLITTTSQHTVAATLRHFTSRAVTSFTSHPGIPILYCTSVRLSCGALINSIIDGQTLLSLSGRPDDSNESPKNET